MPYEDDIRNESTTSRVAWTISVAMFAAAAAMILFVLATH